MDLDSKNKMLDEDAGGGALRSRMLQILPCPVKLGLFPIDTVRH